MVESYGCTSAGIIIGIEHAALERCTGEESGSPNLALSRLEPKISEAGIFRLNVGVALGDLTTLKYLVPPDQGRLIICRQLQQLTSPVPQLQYDTFYFRTPEQLK